MIELVNCLLGCSDASELGRDSLMATPRGGRRGGEEKKEKEKEEEEEEEGAANG